MEATFISRKDTSSTNSALIIFLKYPEPGKVKTRIGASIGNEWAASIYKRMSETVINNASKSNEYSIKIFFHPPDKRNEIEQWLSNGNFTLAPQKGVDLGERIINAFETMFAAGYKKVVIIGTDCIEVNSALLSYAFESLQSHEVVVGPAKDGGYYLLGMKELNKTIFDDIEWSTDKVFDQTMYHIQRLGFRCKQLEILNDIDSIEDIITHHPEFLDS